MQVRSPLLSQRNSDLEEDEKQNHARMKDGVMEEVRRIFKPEFLNRIDETVVFRELNQTDLKKISSILLNELKTRCAEQLSIELKVSDSAKNWIVEKAYDRKYGARPLKRKIQETIEDPLAEMIVSGKVKENDKVSVSVKKKELVIERTI